MKNFILLLGFLCLFSACFSAPSSEALKESHSLEQERSQDDAVKPQPGATNENEHHQRDDLEISPFADLPANFEWDAPVIGELSSSSSVTSFSVFRTGTLSTSSYTDVSFSTRTNSGSPPPFVSQWNHVIAPVSGIYMFQYTMPATSTSSRARLMKDSSVVSSMSPYYGAGSDTVILALNKFDHVYVQTSGSISCSSLRYCSFSGFLLQ